MKHNLFYFLTFLSAFVSVTSYESSELKCLICKAVAQEIENASSKVPKTSTVQVGGYNLDDKGDIKRRSIPKVYSEQYLSELIDDLCEKAMPNYVRVTDKVTKKLDLLNLGDPSAALKFGDIDFVQDSDLNQSVEYLCKRIVEEFEDDIYEVFGKPSENKPEEFCKDSTKLCEQNDKDEL